MTRTLWQTLSTFIRRVHLHEKRPVVRPFRTRHTRRTTIPLGHDM